MSIIVDETTRLLFFGMTGKFGRYHAERLNEAFPEIGRASWRGRV